MANRVHKGPLVIPLCMQIKLQWSLGTRQWLNIVYGSNNIAGPVNPAQAETLFSAFKTAFVSSLWQAHVIPAVHFDAVLIKDLRFPYQPEYQSSSTFAVGTAIAGGIPLSSATVVTLRTNQSGKQWRGRIYLAGMDLDSLTDPLSITAATMTAAETFADGIRSALGSQSLPMVVAQRELDAGQDSHGNPLPARPANTVPVTDTVVINNRIDSQRRRTGR